MGSKELAKRYLKMFEGNESDVYQDSKGIDTVGPGLALRSPATASAFKKQGINVEDVRSGKKLKPKVLDKALDDVLSQKEEIVNTMQKTSFPSGQLNDAKKAALLSLAYNSPQLIGSSLRKKLDANDDLGAMEEIALRTNKEKSPGVLYRRLQEAELFGGPLDFNQMVQGLSEEEKNLVFNTLNETKDPQRKAEIMKRFPQFSPSFQDTNDFLKLNSLLKRK